MFEPARMLFGVTRAHFAIFEEIDRANEIVLDEESDTLKNVQGSIAAKTMMAYGADPSEGRPATLPKTTVITIIVRSG
jgi:hypothetical protein